MKHYEKWALTKGHGEGKKKSDKAIIVVKHQSGQTFFFEGKGGLHALPKMLIKKQSKEKKLNCLDAKRTQNKTKRHIV